MSADSKNILIIGGGISGLATAYYLSKFAQNQGVNPRIAVLEASERFGGAVHTEKKDGMLLEHGPDSFATDKPEALELCRELGLENELIGIHPDFRRIFLRHEDKLFAIPKDFHLMAPARLKTLTELSFLSLIGKLRMAAELFIPKQTGNENESLGNFMERRFGREALERIGQPFMGSIFGCDIRNLSLKETFPRFRQLEEKYGSVIRGLQAGAKERSAATAKQQPSPLGMFVTLRSGLSTLIEALRKNTDAEWINRARATQVAQGKRWKVFLQDGRVFESDFLCLAQPSFKASALFHHMDPSFEKLMASQPSKSMYVVHALYKEEDVVSLPKGSGFVGVADSQQKIQGCSFSSMKFDSRCPEKTRLIRIFTGWQWHETFEHLPDEKIGETVESEFRKFFKIKNPAISIQLSRHERSMPHYWVGQTKWLEELQDKRESFPGLFLSGASYQGASLPCCIASAKEAARAITLELQSRAESKNFQESHHAHTAKV